MKTIIVHDADDENSRILIPVDNIRYIAEYIENGEFVVKINMKTNCEGGFIIDVSETLDEINAMIN